MREERRWAREKRDILSDEIHESGTFLDQKKLTNVAGIEQKVKPVVKKKKVKMQQEMDLKNKIHDLTDICMINPFCPTENLTKHF